MMDIIDIHTHRTDATAALISADPRHFDPQPGLWYSVGIHPWDTSADLTDDDFSLLESCAAHPQVLAIGETGMDRLQGGELTVQESVFIRHLQVAHDEGLPVIVHNVRCTQDILNARRKAGMEQVAMIIHGMRGNKHIARTLLEAGCYLSYGARFNPAALLSTPLDRLLIETDDTPSTTIDEVAALVAQALSLTPEEVICHVITNILRLFKQ